MNDLDTTPTGAGPHAAGPRMAALAARVEEALSRPVSGSSAYVEGTRERMAGFVADPASYDRDSLLVWLSLAVGDKAALDALGMKPPRRGLVYCCSKLGWVTPAEKFDHQWDAYSGWSDDL